MNPINQPAQQQRRRFICGCRRRFFRAKQEEVHTKITKVHHDITIFDNFFEQSSKTIFVNENKDKNVEMIYKFRSEESPHKLTIELYDPTTEKKEVIEGKIMEKEIAEEKYDDNIAEGNRAFMLNRESRKFYSLTLGNIKPKMEVSVITKIVKDLAKEIEEDEKDVIIYNVKVPSYTSPKCVSKKKLTPIVSVNVNVKIENAKVLKCMSPTHPFNFEGTGNSYKTKGDKQLYVNEGFEFNVTTEGQAISTCLISEIPKEINCFKGFKYSGLVSLLPNFPPEELKTYKSEMLLVVDCSGSMMGERIKNAQAALLLFLKSLDVEKDIKYNIFRYGNKFEYLHHGSVDINDEEKLKVTQKYVEKNMKADMGGTNALDALKYILGLEEEKESVKSKLRFCEEQKKCTKHVTSGGKCLAAKQECYECKDCKIKEMCKFCADDCHKDHKIERVQLAYGNDPYTSCECGKNNCNLFKKGFGYKVPTNPYKNMEKDGYQKNIFFFSDGVDQNTNGIKKVIEQEVIKKKRNIRIWSFGIGNDVNRLFLHRIAYRGKSCFIRTNEEIKAKTLEILKYASKASLENCELKFSNHKNDIIQLTNKDKKLRLFNGIMENNLYFFKSLPKKISFKYENFEGKKIESECSSKLLKDYGNTLNILVAKHYCQELESEGRFDYEENYGSGFFGYRSNKKNPQNNNVKIGEKSFVEKKKIKLELGLNYNIVTSETCFFLKSESNDTISELKKEVVNSLDNSYNRQKYTNNKFGIKKKKKKRSRGARRRRGRGRGRGGRSFQVNKAFTGTHGSDWMEKEKRKDKKSFSGTHGSDWSAPTPSGNAVVKIEHEKSDIEKAVTSSNLNELLLNASMKGEWKYNLEILKKIGIKEKELKDKKPENIDIDIWFTSVIVAVLSTLYISQKSEWELIVKKSKRIIKKADSLLEFKAKEFVNSLI